MYYGSSRGSTQYEWGMGLHSGIAQVSFESGHGIFSYDMMNYKLMHSLCD